jgi:hypothetical protein
VWQATNYWTQQIAITQEVRANCASNAQKQSKFGSFVLFVSVDTAVQNPGRNGDSTAKDAEAITALTYWEGVDSQRREFAIAVYREVSKAVLEKVSFKKSSPDKNWDFSWKGARYTRSLKPVGTLWVAGPPDAQGGKLSMGFPVGVKDGRYYLVEAVKLEAASGRE